MPASRTAIDLYWIPLGAGGHSVRFNGRVFEALAAVRRRRRPCDLYHAALVVELAGERYTIELAPSPDADGASRGVVGTGAVGSRWLGSSRWFRYEVRCWRGGCIPDLGAAIGGPRRLTRDPRTARRVLDLVARAPRPVWGRDELKTGEMWNSNSMTAWLIATAGLPTAELRPPSGGRAPGWRAGLDVALRAQIAAGEGLGHGAADAASVRFGAGIGVASADRAVPASRTASMRPGIGALTMGGSSVRARLENGPMKGETIDVDLVEARPPKTIEVPAAHQEVTYRYCLSRWTQAGDTADYTFLYAV